LEIEKKKLAAEKKKREEAAAKQGESMKSFLEKQYDLEEKTTTEFVKKYRSPEKPEKVVKTKEEEEAEPDKKAPRKRVVKKEITPAPAAGTETSEKPEPAPEVSDSSQEEIDEAAELEMGSRNRKERETMPMSQKDIDESAENEMGDRMKRDKGRETMPMSQEQIDEASEYEMGDRINKEGVEKDWMGKTGKKEVKPNEFDPEEELKNLRNLPKNERAARLKEIKEKLTEQKEGLSKVQEDVINTIRANPNASVDELYNLTVKSGEKFGINEKQKAIAKEVLEKYHARHAKIKEVRAQYPNDKELYKTLFGKEPVGKIEMVEDPASIYFKCDNAEDYARIYNFYALQNRELSQGDIKLAGMTGGVSLAGSKISGLEGAIIAENSSLLGKNSNNAHYESQWKKVHDHEEQHSVYTLFKGTAEYHNALEKIQGAKSDEEKKLAYKRLFRNFSQPAEESWKNEILAYFIEGRQPDDTFQTLTKPKEQGGFYDHGKDNGEKIREWINGRGDRGDDLKVAEQAISEGYADYPKLIRNGIDTINYLEKNGYSKEQAIALLIHEPLSRWEKVVNRLYETPGKKELEKKGGEEKVDMERVHLEALVENARRDFARKDYETNNTWQKLRRVLRLKETTPGNLQDTLWEFNQYKIAKNELFKYRADEIQGKNLPPDEFKKQMGELAKDFQENELMNLFAARTGARAKSVEEKYGKAPGKIMEGASKFINWHRKLDWKKKMAFSVALGLSGVGIAVLANRVVGGVVAGAGVAGGLEARYRRKEGERLAGEREKMIQETEMGKSPEEKLNMLMAKLEAEGDKFQQHLKREQNNARWRKAGGAAVATFIGSGAAGYILRWGGEKTGANAAIKSGFGKAAAFFGYEGGIHGGGAANKVVEHGVHRPNPVEVAKGLQGKNSILEHMKGGKAVGPIEPGVKRPGAEEVINKLRGGAVHHEPKGGGGARAEISTLKASGGIEHGVKGHHHLGKGGMSVEKPKFVDLEVKKGSSMEGTLIKNLTAHGMDKVEAGRTAHIMANTFATKHHLAKGPFGLVHEGTHMKLSPDGSKIMSVAGDNKMGWIEKAPQGGKHFSLANPEQIKSAGTAGRIAEHGINHHPNPVKTIDSLQHHGDGASHGAHAAVENMPQGGKMTGALAQWAENIKNINPDTIAVTKPTPLSAIVEKHLLDQIAEKKIEVDDVHKTTLALTKLYVKNFADAHPGMKPGPDMLIPANAEVKFSAGNSSLDISEKIANNITGTVKGSAEAVINKAPEINPGGAKIAENLANVPSGTDTEKIAKAAMTGVAFGAGGVAAPTIAGGLAIKEVRKNRREKTKKESSQLAADFSKNAQAYYEALGAKNDRDTNISLKNIWDKVKEIVRGKNEKSFDELKTEDAATFLKKRSNKKNAAYFLEEYGTRVEPKENETLDAWVKRVTLEIVRSNKKGEDIFDAAA
jgi:hypothetical protein